VDDTVDLGFALETQTRPVYSPLFFTDPAAGDTVFVHELAHQWYGDLVRVDLWRDVWLNEGFATYAEWLWGEHEGLTTPQQEFDKIASQASPAFWQTTVVDPGSRTDLLFGAPVYYRGAMTLQALRKTVGDDAFFRILRTWAASHAGRTGTTEQFTSLAERISGQHLGDLFRIWLYTPQKPAELG
jgi:aminopeptidase N